MTARQRLPSDREIERVITKLRSLGVSVGAVDVNQSQRGEARNDG